MVSIIVPVYNREKELDICVSSLIKQTFNDLEIILVDDGSTDSSPLLCDEFALKYSNLKVFHNSKLGVSETRNFGLKKASGEYICFVDSDDYIDEKYIEKLYNSITSGDYNISICDYFEVTEDNKKICTLPYDKKEFSSLKLLNDILYGRTTNSFCWGRMWKKDFIKATFKKISYCEDTVFNVENLSVPYMSVSYVKEPLYFYVRHKNSITGQEKAGHLNDILNVAEIISDISEKDAFVNTKAARSLIVNYSFFVYLITVRHIDSEEYCFVKERSRSLIKKYNVKALFDFKSTIKTKAACILSLFSMSLVEKVYYIIHKKT